MSYRSRAAFLIMLCGMLVLASCGVTHPDLSDAFERGFQATAIIQSGDKEYRTSVTMTSLFDVELGGAEELGQRDGSICYLSPDSVSDISAQRSGGVVTIRVCGIEITPSPSLSAKYVMPIDWFDLRGSMLCNVKETECDGSAFFEAEYITENGDVTVLFDRDTKLPISVSMADTKITFTEFVYT